MKYDYIVKSGGVYYAAGEDVPEEDVGAESVGLEPKTEPEKEPENSELDMEELPFSDSDIQLETEPVRRGRHRKSDM